MYRNYHVPDIRSAASVRIALGTFVMLWVVSLAGLVWGRSGTMPSPLMAAFDFVYIDVLYMTGFELRMSVHSGLRLRGPLGYVISSSIGYAILALFAATWYHVLREWL